MSVVISHVGFLCIADVMSNTYILRLYMIILVPVLHFSKPVNSSSSSCSVVNIEYLRMALRLDLLLSVDTMVSEKVKKRYKSAMIRKRHNKKGIPTPKTEVGKTELTIGYLHLQNIS